MSRTSSRALSQAVLLVGGVALLGLAGRTAWRIGQSAALARRSEPLQQQPAAPTMRLLVVGDSTAVGRGASEPRQSLAGLIAARHPRWWVENRARDGARFANLMEQLDGVAQFDIVLVQAGGNDVMRLVDLDALGNMIERVAAAAAALGKRVVLMPAGNVGNAPFFFAPLSWWMTWRSRALHRFVAEAAARHGAVYVRLFRERADDPFATQRALNAADGLHPSDAGYRVWFNELLAQSKLF